VQRRPPGRSLRRQGPAAVLSLAAHAALLAALALAGAAPTTEGRQAPGPGGLVWVDLAGPAEAGGPPAAERPAPAPRPRSATPPPVAAAAPSPAPSLDAPAAEPRAARTGDTGAAPATSRSDALAARADAAKALPEALAADAEALAAAAGALGALAPGGPGAGPAGGDSAADRPPRWPGPGHVDRPARPRGRIRPHYPATARRRGDESLVVVEAWVDDGGGVAFSSVVRSGGRDFDDSALRAVRRASFRPARLRGRAVASRVALRIHFALRD